MILQDLIIREIEELKIFVNDESMAYIPIIFLANKQDPPSSTTKEMIIEQLEINFIKHRPWYMRASALIEEMESVYEYLIWLQLL